MRTAIHTVLGITVVLVGMYAAVCQWPATAFFTIIAGVTIGMWTHWPSPGYWYGCWRDLLWWWDNK
tara:strand:+ start:1022 stop:1219 length:198 start_codon:yes stop_codon:yes gene_type:complete